MYIEYSLEAKQKLIGFRGLGTDSPRQTVQRSSWQSWRNSVRCLRNHYAFRQSLITDSILPLRGRSFDSVKMHFVGVRDGPRILKMEKSLYCHHFLIFSWIVMMRFIFTNLFINFCESIFMNIFVHLGKILENLACNKAVLLLYC